MQAYPMMSPLPVNCHRYFLGLHHIFYIPQTRLEELLKVYPPEAVERRRYEKVAKALGTRTPQQVREEEEEEGKEVFWSLAMFVTGGGFWCRLQVMFRSTSSNWPKLVCRSLEECPT